MTFLVISAAGNPSISSTPTSTGGLSLGPSLEHGSICTWQHGLLQEPAGSRIEKLYERRDVATVAGAETQNSSDISPGDLAYLYIYRLTFSFGLVIP